MRKDFYVYIHKRKSDGLVFYVGKGCGKRAWYKRDKSDWWKNTASKHGLVVEIVKNNMPEHCAHLYERILIRGLRGMGLPLVNITDGGEGCSGRKMSKENRAILDFHKSRPIFCSNGMSFENRRYAVNWLRDSGFGSASITMLSRVVDVESATAYGHSWSNIGTPIEPKNTGRDAKSSAAKKAQSIGVFCSNGMYFASITLAVEWLSSNGWPKASSGGISACSKGEKYQAYGLSWSYIGVPELNEIANNSVPVRDIDGNIFKSGSDAGDYMVRLGFEKASGSKILACANGLRKSAYGKKWFLV